MATLSTPQKTTPPTAMLSCKGCQLLMPLLVLTVIVGFVVILLWRVVKK